jgi:hypothetical protein
MPRPKKYNTEAERLEAVRAQSRERMRKHRVMRNKKDVTENHIHVTQNVTHNFTNNKYSDKDYEELETKYKALLHEVEITNEYCKELEEQLAEAKEMGY